MFRFPLTRMDVPPPQTFMQGTRHTRTELRPSDSRIPSISLAIWSEDQALQPGPLQIFTFCSCIGITFKNVNDDLSYIFKLGYI